MVVQIEACHRFVCIVFVSSPHSSNEEHVKLDILISIGHKHVVLCFCFAELGIGPSAFTKFTLIQVSFPLVWVLFLVFSKLLKLKRDNLHIA